MQDSIYELEVRQRRYIKTDPQELEHIGIKQHRDGSLNYEEWKKKVAADLIHPDFRTHFLERFSLATLREYLQVMMRV